MNKDYLILQIKMVFMMQNQVIWKNEAYLFPDNV
jgi:hypothetical protein